MKLLLFLFMPIFIFSCGKVEGNKRETRIEETDIPEVMKHQKFECASISGPCPSGIARLLIVNTIEPEFSALCTGFMVGPDKLITNNHCVSTQEQCNTTFIAVYNGTSYLTTKCKSIIKTETDGPDANDPDRRTDYTLMSVTTPFPGSYFPITAKKARAGEILNAWVVDHTGLDIFPPNLTDSRITQLQCKVANQSYRASLMMNVCPIIAGNSGSPVINRNGEVSGVLWGGSASTFDSTLDLDIRRKLDEIGLATPAEDFRHADQPLP